MSRPRKPFGTDLPGRLPATMIKVLAAEMSDAARLQRGKRYWADGAVVDIVVGHGAVTAEVQGSRPEPYVVTIEARPGHQAPGRAEVTVRCTCPDDDGTGRSACKHAVAALFTLADEVALEPAVLARWRRSDEVAPRSRAVAAVPDAPPTDRPRVPDDGLGALLVAPDGATPPDVPLLAPLPFVPVPDRVVSEVLADALDHLAIRWE